MLRSSKIFGFTSLKEALPTVLAEAMFCGNAIVSYNCNYGPSDIINEKNGFLIHISDRESFKEKLEFLTNNEDALNNLMTTSFRESKNWKKEKILEKWTELLNH